MELRLEFLFTELNVYGLILLSILMEWFKTAQEKYANRLVEPHFPTLISESKANTSLATQLSSRAKNP